MKDLAGDSSLFANSNQRPANASTGRAALYNGTPFLEVFLVPAQDFRPEQANSHFLDQEVRQISSAGRFACIKSEPRRGQNHCKSLRT
jgi:hypothetical protein